MFVRFVTFVSFVVFGLTLVGQQAKTFIPHTEALPILLALREDLVPADLRNKTAPDLALLWPRWIAARDTAVRSRVAEGDADSIAYLLLFGTTFTSRPRITERELAALALQPAEGMASLQPRIADFVAALDAPGANERLQFARQVLARAGIDPAAEAGKVQARRYLEVRAASVAANAIPRSSTLLDPAAAAADTQTLFKDRGLSSDTSIFVDYGIDQTLDAMLADGRLRPGGVRRVAIVGPGLDFTDKLDGYDFYAQQTIQPFAVVDSLLRRGLASPDLEVTAFDLSPRVVEHLEAARTRARGGNPYALVLPRNLDRPWTPGLVQYWQRLGAYVGEETKAPPPPANAGRLEVRSVSVRPSVVLTVVPRDLDIVFERIESGSPDERFDIVIATNILLYYGVFEQSLAAANIATMLRPGGFLLSNNQVFELPPIPLAGVGYTDATYMSLTGIGDTGDRIVWYQRQ